MRTVLEVLSPNKVISKKVVTMLFGYWILVAFLFWIFGPSRVVPRPMEVFNSYGPLLKTGLLVELIVSIKTSLEAIIIASLLAGTVSYLTVMPVVRPLALLFSKGRFLGLAGLTFLFTLLTGGGHNLKLALMVFGISVFLVDSLAQMVAEIPKSEYDHARTLRMSEWRVVWEVVVLGKLHMALEILRQNAAISWMMLTMVEGIVKSEGGIGAMLLAENKHFKLAEVFAIQMVIVVVGLGQDYLLGVIRRIICPHAYLTLDRRS